MFVVCVHVCVCVILLAIIFHSNLLNRACKTDDCCPDGWSHFGSRCFMFFRKPKTWIDAELSCIEIGGNLASIHSSDDNQFIQDTVLRLTGSHWRVWIGGHDGVEEGVWQWTDGSPFDFNHWNYGEPNNFRGEHCLVMNWGAHLWSDYRCTYRLPYMCSSRPVPKTRTRH
uniref:C-type lectin domain-containing protein n=1 Tax=Periophthalmus magnuspinnatus TaxID=409849 RepID=A0A3B3ZY74_9GOBI